MKVVIINDNTKRLEHWKLSLEDKFTVSCFSHPNYCELEELGEVICFIVDKFYANKDLLYAPVMERIKSSYPRSLFFVGSSDHEEGDFVKGYDCVFSTPVSSNELQEAIEKCKKEGEIKEIILATNSTMEGQLTAQYIAEQLLESGIFVTRLAHGMPIGSELDFIDEGTLSTAFKLRSQFK